MPANPKSVLLVHGIFDTGSIFKKLSAFLQSHGWETCVVDLSPCYGLAPIPMYALQLQAAIRRLKPQHLVGFSMGGIVCRYYLQKMEGHKNIRSLVTIGAPHQGSWASWLYPVPAAWQMRPGSPLLRELKSSIDIFRKVQHTFIWTPYDFMVYPADNSRCTEYGNEIRVPAESHGCLLVHPEVHSNVLAALDSAVD